MLLKDELFNFESAPDVDLGFDMALKQAVDEWNDEAADLIRQHMYDAKLAGDFDLLAQRVMALGATACMHEHLQSLSKETTDLLSIDKDEHGHNHDSTKCDNCKNGKKCQHSSNFGVVSKHKLHWR